MDELFTRYMYYERAKQGNKSLLEKRINIRASDYRFEDKIKYYKGFTK